MSGCSHNIHWTKRFINWHFFTLAKLSLHLFSVFIDYFLLITARKICQVGLWGLLYLRVVCQATLDSKRRKLSGSNNHHIQLFEIIFWSFRLYGWSNKFLPQPHPKKEKEARRNRPTKLCTGKNFCLVLGETAETQEGGQIVEPYFIKRQGAKGISR